MFLNSLGGERINKMTYNTARHFIDFLKIWKDMEVGENFELEHDSILGYLNHLHSLSDFWGCETQDDFYETFTKMAIENKLHLFQFIKMTPWQKRILRNGFPQLTKTKIEDQKNESAHKETKIRRVGRRRGEFL
jgi:hypothetical protein